ncbi:hypothetical protein [Aquipseudomonas alcaligenes]|uniref:hypothetical protein n=1 Tax=Aquipseudomonas alcaligenes TaxID=43263 RepID=UPI00142FC8F9|nr:hypothetical protein [Pseudomonas alcaligenes]
MKSLRKGLSGMDAARAAMGHGWPFAAGPWSNDGTKGVSRSETRMSGVLSLWLLSLCTSKEKVTRREGENRNYCAAIKYALFTRIGLLNKMVGKN